ncbi:MAG: hypothetical protein ABSH25_00485 [Syntrophorhabdales bacterium]
MLPHTDGDRSTSRKRLLIISLLLVAAGLIAFRQVTGSGFTSYGDTLYLTKNAHVQNSLTLEGIGWAFTAGHAANWHPLTWISHMMDVQLFGMRPGWHHLTNLLLRLVNTVLLFLLLFRMTRALWLAPVTPTLARLRT